MLIKEYPLVRGIVNVLQSNKAINIAIFVGKIEYFVDFIVICSCTSERHLRGIADKVCLHLKHENQIIPRQNCGSSSWEVVDAHHGIIHIMSQTMRERYDIDGFMHDIGNKQIDIEQFSTSQ